MTIAATEIERLVIQELTQRAARPRTGKPPEGDLRQRIQRIDYHGAPGRISIHFRDDAPTHVPARPQTQEMGP